MTRPGPRWLAAKRLLIKSKADLARSDKLLPSGAVSREEYDQHFAAKDMAEAQLQAAKAAVRDCELNLEFTNITAPIAGQIEPRETPSAT